MNKLVERVRELSVIPGVSGCEDDVREAILALVKDHCAKWEVDPLGNLLVFKEGKARAKNKVLLSAHMDEVGFIITHVEDSGLLRFANVGGIDGRVIVGKSVEIGPNRVYGVIGLKAIHQQTEKERDSVPDRDKLYIDIGAQSREEAMTHAKLGDRAVFHSEFFSLGEDCILGRALDDRAGCALLVELIRSDLPCDCHFSFTVQEETGCTGGVTAGFSLSPDIAVAVETTTAADIAGVPPDQAVCKLGEGPVISFMDKGTVYDRALYALAFETAAQEGLRCQTKSVVAGGNESRSLQTAAAGARVMALSLPCRYLHSPSCVLHKGDVGEAYRLLDALIPRLAQL